MHVLCPEKVFPKSLVVTCLVSLSSGKLCISFVHFNRVQVASQCIGWIAVGQTSAAIHHPSPVGVTLMVLSRAGGVKRLAVQPHGSGSGQEDGWAPAAVLEHELGKWSPPGQMWDLLGQEPGRAGIPRTASTP